MIPSEYRRAVAMLATLAMVFVSAASGASSHLTTTQVVQGFKSAGIPIGKVVTYTAADDPNKLLGRPGQYVAKAAWIDKRITSDGTDGGTVEIFSSKSELDSRLAYVKAIEGSSPLFLQYIYTDGLAMVRLDSDLTPAAAKKYSVALRAIAG